MIYVEGIDGNTIDLNSDQDTYELSVVSKDENERKSGYDITIVSSKSLTVKKYGDTLSVTADTPNILKEETIVLSNLLGDVLVIRVIPNEYYTMDRTYKFKIGKRTYQNDGSLKVKIISTMNDGNMGWKCTYDGRPMNYVISPFEGEGSCNVVIKPNTNVLSEFDALVVFTQEESGETIRLTLHNTTEGIKKGN